MKKETLEELIKNNFESISTNAQFIHKCPLVIRVDGQHFHTLTKSFDKPFDDVFRSSMIDTMEFMCKNIQGCIFGYTQSDEITLILLDDLTDDTQGWFDYKIQKIVSSASSLATFAFNKYLEQYAFDSSDTYKYINHIATFDARAFSVPMDYLWKVILWRQNDCIRNSIQSVARTYFSESQCHGLNTSELRNKLYETYKIDWWCDFPRKYQFGVSCYRHIDDKWCINLEMEKITKQFLDEIIERAYTRANNKKNKNDSNE